MDYDYGRLTMRIRKKYGTVCNFAEVCGISQNTLYRKLHGHGEWRQYEMDLFCKLLDIPFSELHNYFFSKEV